MQFLVTVQKLSLHVGVIEPFFGTLAVYDLKTGNRMSEVGGVRVGFAEHLCGVACALFRGVLILAMPCSSWRLF